MQTEVTISGFLNATPFGMSKNPQTVLHGPYLIVNETIRR